MVAPSSAADPGLVPRAPRWGLAVPLGTLVLGVIGATLGALTAAVATGAAPGEASLATSIGSLAGMWAVYGAVIVTTVKSRGSGHVVDDVGLRFRPIDLLTGIAGGIVSTVVIVQLVYVFLQLTSVVDDSDLQRLDDPALELRAMADGPGFLLLALFVGIGAPVMEEIFFRGFLQPAAIRRLGTTGGLLLTALVFAAVHFQLLQFPALAAFGLVLGLLAHRTRRLGPAIVAHMVFNGLTLASLAAT